MRSQPLSLAATCAQTAEDLDQTLAEIRQPEPWQASSALTFPGSLERTSEELSATQCSLAGEDTARPQLGNPPEWGDRYEDLGLLGIGGMGQVRRVRDRVLGRTVAMKIAHRRVDSRPSSHNRFVAEAQATAQLQHPGIVPVHELGQLPDGRCYFTMTEVRGRTLSEVIRSVHQQEPEPLEQTALAGWSFRRLVDAFFRVCKTVSFAHDRGVLHRDLKPDNIMLGSHGEVLVLDWGVAKVGSGAAPSGAPQDSEQVITDRSQDRAQLTRMGLVAGTPAYMPPEQARGELDRIDARSDVYALGAVLYEILTGRPPYQGSTAEVLAQVRAGPAVPVHPNDARCPPASQATMPEELVDACTQAMAREPSARFDTAGELARVVSDWLDGARRREKALAIEAGAREIRTEARAMRDRAADLRASGEALLEAVESWAPEEQKTLAWARIDAASTLEQCSALAHFVEESRLRIALSHAPDLPEAHAALAQRYRLLHQQEEAELHEPELNRLELLLRQHASALPSGHPERQSHFEYLEGNGVLSLVTDPPGAEVLLHRYTLQNRRLVPRFIRSLGRAPLEAVSLPMGSYLCVLRRAGHADVHYPIRIRRQQHWSGVAPGMRATQPIWLPESGLLGADDCYVPAGWFLRGGDSAAIGACAHESLWVDGLVVRRHPVTNREYIAFLDQLVALGKEDEALRHVPRERSAKADQRGPMLYGRRSDGRFELVPDADGDRWDLDWPVCMVSWYGAMAYAAWERKRTGQPWRLPRELEWEKSARGVDGRRFPWGDSLDPSWCHMRQSHAGRMLPQVIGSRPFDQSVYGVRGMAGNMKDWCLDSPLATGLSAKTQRVAPATDPLSPSTDPPSENRAFRGGSWINRAALSHCASRQQARRRFRDVCLGFRLVRSAGPPPTTQC